MRTDTRGPAQLPGRHRAGHRLLVVTVLAVLLMTSALVWSHDSAASEGRDAISLDPAAFAKGACVALSPTHGDRHQTVFLDAGHGGLDPGAVGTTSSGATIDEAAVTLPVELDAASLLRARGFRVVVSRTRDSSVVKLTSADVDGQLLTLQGAHDDVVARDTCADLADASVLLGIYFDSGGSTQNAGSLTTYDADRPFSAANLQLANLVQADVLHAMNAQGWQIPDAGVVPDSDVGSLVPSSATTGIAAQAASYGHVVLLGPALPGFLTTPTTMPGALIEPLFITDPFEGSLAASAHGQEVIARGLARAVEQYLPSPTSHPKGS